MDFTQTQTHSRCSWYRPSFLRCPSKYDFGDLTPFLLSNFAVVPGGLEMGVLPNEWKVVGWWIQSLCWEELTDLWFKQTGNGKPIELMSYHRLFLMYFNLAPLPTPPHNKGSTQAPHARLGKSRRMWQKVAKKQPSMTPPQPQPQPLTLSQPHTPKSLPRPQMIVYSIPTSSRTSGYWKIDMIVYRQQISLYRPYRIIN